MFSWNILNLFKNKDDIDPAQQGIVTRSDIDKQFENRYARINKEIKEGLELVRRLPKSVTLFGSARLPEDHPSCIQASTIAKRLADEGFAVISGGGHGIMKAANCGAKQSDKGQSVGFNIKLPHEQTLNTCIDTSLEFHYFFSRKLALTFSAEAYVYFPGGYGTFDELFEIMTLVQTKKIERVPIILVGSDFWNKFDVFIKVLLRDTYKTIDPDDISIYTITDDVDEVVNIIKNAEMRRE